MCVRVSACELAEVCVCKSAGDPCDSRTSDCVRVCVSRGTSGFWWSESLSLRWSDLEEEGSWDVEDTTGEGGGSVDKRKESDAGLGLVRDDAAALETEEDVGRTRDGEEVEDGLGAAKEERRGLTAEGVEEEEDLEMGDLGAEEEELVLEDVVLLSEWWW